MNVEIANCVVDELKAVRKHLSQVYDLKSIEAYRCGIFVQKHFAGERMWLQCRYSNTIGSQSGTDISTQSDFLELLNRNIE